jgi:DUF971 family protein
MKPIPKDITLDTKAGHLIIIWRDGKTCTYPLPELREACPCVECRGGHEKMGSAYDPDNLLTLTPARSYSVVDLQMVGQYALMPIWDDGHQTGIYTWEYLYKLCPAMHSSQH